VVSKKHDIALPDQRLQGGIACLAGRGLETAPGSPDPDGADLQWYAQRGTKRFCTGLPAPCIRMELVIDMHRDNRRC